MTDYLVYNTKAAAQSAADDLWTKYGPTVNETTLAGEPTGKPQVTVRWSEPIQRKDGSWIIHDHETIKVEPVNAAKAVEPYDKTWFDDPTAVKKA